MHDLELWGSRCAGHVAVGIRDADARDAAKQIDWPEGLFRLAHEPHDVCFFTYVTGHKERAAGSCNLLALRLVVKNSILLVDFTNQLREQGVGLDEAIQRAGEASFIPILLTTLTVIGGLLPLVLEQSSLYSPLALVILGGTKCSCRRSN